MGEKMRVTYSIDDNGKYMIHIYYVLNTNKATERAIIKKIPKVLKEIKEQKIINKKINKIFNKGLK